MFIKEIIIEGFKSYATRTVISGWDPEFNAITGLNGSGKSNILDSICFVLGISNLSQVRASNLQDLVYKRGQAGVTKASVTIEFDNSDRANSPIGYEEHKTITITRQIVLGGHNKYLINGHNAQQKIVANLFQSVQLNVNNPHFLIMQGRITKVLNMKPPEILSMIEEAAGTRMFEDKKDSAIKTIEKKEKKLEEINTLLREEITPKLDKLRRERSAFIEFQKVETDLERLGHLVIAHEYHSAQEKLRCSRDELQGKTNRITELEEEQAAINHEIKASEDEAKRITQLREKETGGQFEKLEKRLEKMAENLVRVKTQCDSKADEIKDEEANVAKLNKSLVETKNNISAKNNEHLKMEADFTQSKTSHDAKSEEVRKVDELLSTLLTGTVSGDGEGYMEQLQAAKVRAADIGKSTQQAKLKVDHLTKEKKELQQNIKQLELNNKALSSKHEAASKDLKAIEGRLAQLSYDPAKAALLTQQRDKLQQEVNSLRGQYDTLSDGLSRINFSYSDPTANFNRKQVHGLVANLISIAPDHMNAATAIEVAAGGRLYSVVVDNEVVGTQLLEKGKLQKRVTIIPLNKIHRQSISKDKISKAKALAPGRVELALSLVGFEDDVAAAMEFVFGSTIICQDKEAAKAVTFEAKLRSVTLEGDVYEPSGTLTGGSAPNTNSVLKQLQEVRAIKAQLNERENQLEQLNKQVGTIMKTAQTFKEQTQAVELKQHEVSLLKSQIDQSPHGQATKHLEEIEKEIQLHQATIDTAAEKEKEATKECKRIEKEMNELHTNRDGKLASLKSELAQLKKELSQQGKLYKSHQQAIQTLQLEIAQLQEEQKSIEEQIATSATTLDELRQQLKQQQENFDKINEEYRLAKEQQQRERQKMAAFDDELRALDAHIKKRNESLKEASLEAKRLSLEIAKYQKDRGTAEATVKQIEKQHHWIIDQRHAHDLTGTNANELKKRLEQLEETHARMSKSVNRKVVNMIDRVEKEEGLLKKKLSIVLNDKEKIEATINTLEIKKKEALQKTWEKVNHDFGAIFADLLPTSSCRLSPQEGQEISDGLEIKVNLGGVWKESLTELSGGQRSLVALSLILSLLSYKPAPLYILDEIDAALDLSHTQNIGQLLKTRFHGAQFIVVSLKEGMFNNANVLFKAKFRDGVSHVERHTQQQKKLKN